MNRRINTRVDLPAVLDAPPRPARPLGETHSLLHVVPTKDPCAEFVMFVPKAWLRLSKLRGVRRNMATARPIGVFREGLEPDDITLCVFMTELFDEVRLEDWIRLTHEGKGWRVIRQTWHAASQRLMTVSHKDAEVRVSCASVESGRVYEVNLAAPVLRAPAIREHLWTSGLSFTLQRPGGQPTLERWNSYGVGPRGTMHPRGSSKVVCPVDVMVPVGLRFELPESWRLSRLPAPRDGVQVVPFIADCSQQTPGLLALELAPRVAVLPDIATSVRELAGRAGLRVTSVARGEARGHLEPLRAATVARDGSTQIVRTAVTTISDTVVRLFAFHAGDSSRSRMRAERALEIVMRTAAAAV